MQENTEQSLGMVGSMLKPLLKFTILPMVEKGNPADMIGYLKPILNSDFKRPGTDQRFYPATVTGELYLIVDPYHEKYIARIYQKADNQLVLPLTADMIKSVALMCIDVALQEPDVNEITKQLHE